MSFSHYQYSKISSDCPRELHEFRNSEIEIPDGKCDWEDFRIGEGASARVYEVRIQCDNKGVFADCENEKFENNEKNKEKIKAALKKYRLQGGGDSGQLKNLKREAHLINQLHHKNIVALFGVCYDHLYFGLVLELCEGNSLGSLCRNLNSSVCLSYSTISNWISQILTGMEHVIGQNLLHRDLKADNILIKQRICYCAESVTQNIPWCPYCHNRSLNNLTLKITDFGMTKSILSVGHSIAGTYYWMAPEIIDPKQFIQYGQPKWTEYSDVWSFGVVFWEIMSRSSPGPGQYPINVKSWNFKVKTLNLKAEWPEKWNAIMKRCWSPSPSDRPRFGELRSEFQNDIGKNISYPKAKTNKEKRNKYLVFLIWILIFIFGNFVLLFLISNFLIIKFLEAPENSTLATCLPGFTDNNFTGFCYQAHIFPLPLEEAELKCGEYGGHVASVHSQQENSFLLKLLDLELENYRLSQNTSLQIFDVLISLTYNARKSEWSWTDGSFLNFTNWGDGEPNNVGSLGRVEEYRVMARNQNPYNGSWNNVHIAYKSAFVCKIAKPMKNDGKIILEQAKKIENALAAHSPSCAAGYTFYEDYCYRVDLFTFPITEAIEKCSLENAHLASIHSKSEQDFILELYHKTLALYHSVFPESHLRFSELWIGLFLKNATWQWADGTELDYEHWRAEEPNNLKTEHQVHIIRGEWNNINSAKLATFVCKKKAHS